MTFTQTDRIAIVLANRRFLYEFFQHIFGKEPNNKLIEIITSEHTIEAFRLFLNDNNCKYESYFELLKELKQEFNNNHEVTIDKLRGEYTNLMIGPNKLPAPPWESVYTTKERTLFQLSTLEVRRKYLKYHFLPENYPYVADDHLAIELDFMSNLAKFAIDAFEAGQLDEMKKVLSDQKKFLDEHLLCWTGNFSEQIQTSKTNYFYPYTAKLMDQILRTDSLILDELILLMNN
ncbi:MAG: cytoplasmic chaperone TorD family protein [Neobacillus sp.]|jgi:TorA maturation chaperone TorD|nr:cytoplasmic chaperone TorD family protein [Neobacillus sp.]MDF2858292.1 cytoplasmic chaperone TorD family protein [Neobacillus sp.]